MPKRRLPAKIGAIVVIGRCDKGDIPLSKEEQTKYYGKLGIIKSKFGRDDIYPYGVVHDEETIPIDFHRDEFEVIDYLKED